MHFNLLNRRFFYGLKWGDQNMREKIGLPKIDTVLSEQLRSVLRNAGIRNLRVEPDGSISGESDQITYYPTTHQIHNIRLEEVDGKLMINCNIGKGSEDIGKVI